MLYCCIVFTAFVGVPTGKVGDGVEGIKTKFIYDFVSFDTPVMVDKDQPRRIANASRIPPHPHHAHTATHAHTL